MPSNSKPVVLIAPLDWGLGHATRCVPIVNSLINADFEVIIAAEGAQKALLQNEFPHIKFTHLPGYRLRYGRTKWGTIFKVFFQVPKILTAIRRENKWIQKFAAENRVDFVISDNRYGFYLTGVPSFFITHQLLIKTPFGKWSERVLQKMNYRFIRKFTACWVPDHEGKINLGGELSHPDLMPSIPVHYLGHLSRMKREEREIINDLLVIISGPEPQRSLFEKMIVDQLSQTDLSVIVVRGLPNTSSTLHVSDNIKVYNHLSAVDLNNAISESSAIISRSGYSTVMDLIPLHKKCIFVPTPGQTEQEYLADYLSENSMCINVRQRDFDLIAVLKKLEEADFVFRDFGRDKALPCL
ncbi:glycosyltransferase [Pinibacter aurantiacus]|uniref:Glycosyl transferase family 28 n=1 Tax=Pinibacter aurantiacus TaxID=2851599 RepID=A0A9E2S5V5_9BACT|nr:glycosyltransferase [Pinibacter aurantiacus]MBV4356187.1 glycosyl transferase family 28 [Pinibacter aurantiacus]